MRIVGFVFIALGVTVFLGLDATSISAGIALMASGVVLLLLKGRQGT
jgi:hypothetical protein